jgi:F0F1-type ATP synthase membrane subunit a
MKNGEEWCLLGCYAVFLVLVFYMFLSKKAIIKCLKCHYFKGTPVSVIIITTIVRLLSLCVCLFGWLLANTLLACV